MSDSPTANAREMKSHRSPYIENLRNLGPAQRLSAAEQLYWSARRLKEAAIRAQHSDWTDAQVGQAARDAFARAP